MKIDLGDKVRDVIEGVEGIVVYISRHLTGCDRVGVQPPLDKDGRRQEAEWFDITRLELIQKQAVILPGMEKEKPEPPGGDPTRIGFAKVCP